jgi:WD40 repeat protein
MAISPSPPHFWIGGNNRGTITRLDENLDAVSREYPNRGRVVASQLDPNNPENCLIVWHHGAWALFDPLTVTAVHSVAGLVYSFSCATWSSAVPGQFVTGDSNCGIIRIWNAASTSPIDSINLHTAGVLEILTLPSQSLLIAFQDGMVSVYDFVNKRFVFQNRPAHSNAIIGIRFLPGSSDVFITAGGEAAICVSSAGSMRQLDRIPPLERDASLDSMDVSPGGGVIACGYHNGTIVVFSLAKHSRVFELEISNKPIVSMAFNPREPSLCFCIADDGFICSVNVEKQQIATKSAQFGFARFGGFSPLAGHYAVVGKGGKGEIFCPGDRAITVAEDDITAFVWSPIEPNVFVVADIRTNIYRYNLIDELYCVVTKLSRPARALAFHPTFQNILVTGGSDGFLVVLDISRARILGTICAHSGFVGCLAFSPSNPHLLISGSADASVKFWSLDRMFMKELISHILATEITWIKPLEGNQQLLKLARRICKKPGDKIVFDLSDIPHVNDVVRLASQVVHDSLSGSSAETRLIKRAIRNKGRMIQAAKLELCMGNVKHYCELMFAAGEHDRAVACAPAVSYGFWSEMVKNRAKLYESPDDIAREYLFIGAVDDALSLLLKSDMTDKAFLLAAAQRKGSFQSSTKPCPQQKVTVEYPYIDTVFTNAKLFDEYATASERARHHLKEGEIYYAAASYLSIGDVVTAELLLLRLGQTSTAFLIDSVTGLKNRQVREKFAMFALQSGIKESVFQKLETDEKERIVIALSFPSIDARESFYQSIGLRTVAEYRQASVGAAPFQRLHYLLLAGDTSPAVVFFINFVQLDLNFATKFMEIRDMTKLVELANLDGTDAVKLTQVVCLSLYFACYAAAWKGYARIFKRLGDRILALSQGTSNAWFAPFAVEAVRALKLFDRPDGEVRLYAVGHRFLNTRTLGNSFPSDQKYGKLYFLEDGASYISMEGALMWFELTPFSPVTLGSRYYLL